VYRHTLSILLVVSLASLGGYLCHRQSTYNKFAQASAAADQHGVDLDHEIEVTQHKLYQKEHLVSQLLAEQISLDEAIEQFELLNRGTRTLETCRKLHPTESDQELAVRNLIAFIEKVQAAGGAETVAEANRLQWDVRLLFPNLVLVG
jgi:hypothetical protein